MQNLWPALKRAIAGADENLRLEYEKLCKSLAAVQRIDNNPLANEVREMLALSNEASETSIVVLRRESLWQEAEAVLNPDKLMARIILMKPTELRRISPVDRLILFGPPWSFEFRDELFLFRSPVARSIDLFVYDHDARGGLTASAFDPKMIALNGIDSKPVRPEDLTSEPFMPRSKNFSFGPSEVGLGQEARSHENAEAWAVNLGGGGGTFLSPDGSVFWLECRHDGKEALCVGVERREVEELEVGDLIVLTTEGGGDLVRPLADKILGERSAIFRKRQDEWKEKLVGFIRRDGIDSVVAKLRKLGSSIANVANLRNWAGEQNIGPDDLESDFRAILVFVGLEESGGEYKEAISSIRKAHQSAGFQLHSRLRAGLKGMNVREAFVSGLLEVRGEEEGPVKTIFLVENINREISFVPNSCIGRVYWSDQTDV
jgi:hypothetical protein